MSGNLIGEFKGKITGYRVTEILMNGPKVEVSFRETGKLLGVGASDKATYWSVMTAPDVTHGEGQELSGPCVVRWHVPARAEL